MKENLSRLKFRKKTETGALDEVSELSYESIAEQMSVESDEDDIGITRRRSRGSKTRGRPAKINTGHPRGRLRGTRDRCRNIRRCETADKQMHEQSEGLL